MQKLLFKRLSLVFSKVELNIILNDLVWKGKIERLYVERQKIPKSLFDGLFDECTEGRDELELEYEECYQPLRGWYSYSFGNP
jgi:hypothetical protein